MGIKVHFKDVQVGPGSSKEAQVDPRRVQGCSCSMRSKEVQHGPKEGKRKSSKVHGTSWWCKGSNSGQGGPRRS